MEIGAELYNLTSTAHAADVSLSALDSMVRGLPVDQGLFIKVASVLRATPHEVVERLRPLIARREDFRSVFLSYGTPDEPFARLFYDRLVARGVRTFFFP